MFSPAADILYEVLFSLICALFHVFILFFFRIRLRKLSFVSEYSYRLKKKKSNQIFSFILNVSLIAEKVIYAKLKVRCFALIILLCYLQMVMIPLCSWMDISRLSI